MSTHIVVKYMFGTRYVLTRDPQEWDTDETRAARFDGLIAKKVAAVHGGTVVLLDQHRVVAGELGRENDGGRRT